jgi:hypothetical protein
MRFSAFLLAATVIPSHIPATLAAQKQFEGIITWGSTLAGGRGETVIHVKGVKVRMDISDAQRGAFTSIRDQNGRVLMLNPPKKAFYVLGNAKTLLEPMKYEATGRKETVAGYTCEYYRVLDMHGRNPDDTESCITTALGFAAIGPSGPMSNAEDRSIHEQFRDGFMILKVTHGGKTGVQVLKVEQTAVSDALFAPPSDYTEIKMGGRPGW